jgi:hypothetical protein
MPKAQKENNPDTTSHPKSPHSQTKWSLSKAATLVATLAKEKLRATGGKQIESYFLQNSGS